MILEDMVSTQLLFSTVLAIVLGHTGYFLLKSWIEFRKDAAFGARHGCLPQPQLPNRWPLGLDWVRALWRSDSEQRLLAFLCSIADGYEPRNNLSQYLLFGPRAHHVLDPKNLEAVLSTKFQDYGFGVRSDVFTPLLGHGIFTQEGPAWKHSRDLLRNEFVRTQYHNLENFREHVDNLLDCLSASNGIVDLQPFFFKLTLDTTTALLFGKSANSLRVSSDDRFIDFAKNFDVAQGGLAKRFRMAPWHFFYRPSRFRRACSMVHEFVDRYIDERSMRSTDAKSQENFVDQLTRESNDRVALRDQLLNVLLEGRDTTACCLSWILRLLVRHPAAMERLRQDIRLNMEGFEQPTRKTIMKMSYLGFVIKESLRLFPPVPLNNRTANRTTILPRGGGPDGTAPILVRRGELVVFSQYVNARRKNIFGADADDFRPERWEGDPNKFGWAYFPFNGGPRACLGQDFALMEISYTIVRLLQAFPAMSMPAGRICEPPGTEKQRLTLVLSSANGCEVDLGRAVSI